MVGGDRVHELSPRSPARSSSAPSRSMSWRSRRRGTALRGSAPASAGSAAGQPGATAAGGEGTDYEELAEQVYDKIRARLMTELLLDRERAGMLVDW